MGLMKIHSACRIVRTSSGAAWQAARRLITGAPCGFATVPLDSMPISNLACIFDGAVRGGNLNA